MFPARIFKLCVHAFVAIALFALGLGPASAGSITQYFPAVPAGQSAPARESGWRLSWTVAEPGTTTYGSSAVWAFDKIEFMKGRKADGSEDWIRVLNNLAMAEMHVPYNNGVTVYNDMQMGFGLTPAKADYLPKHGAIAKRLEDRYVISEVVGDGVRWMDNQDDYKVQRGQAIRLWATLVAGNYSYVMAYTFADDGRISVKVGGTAQNLVDLPDFHADMNGATHIHMGAWRMEFDLGNATANAVEVMERLVDGTTGVGTIRHRAFNAGKEGGEAWNADMYTALKITSTQTSNRHSPPEPVSYMLVPAMSGRFRSNEAFTKSDFWVSRLRPDSQSRRLAAPEYKFIDVPGNVASAEPITGKSVVVWHNTAMHHMPHGEDFGPVGYFASDGAAIASYAGFDLVPVNLWDRTPFIKRAPASPVVGGGGDAEPARSLRRGDSGEDVRMLQENLKAKGYDVVVDGNFGTATERAVRRFQQANGLTADGVAGLQTQQRLQAV